MKILGILRSPEFSPNMVDRDSAILHAVKAELEEGGHTVEVVCENDLAQQFDYEVSAYDCIFGMERNTKAIRHLLQKNPDVLFFNPLEGILLTNSRYDLMHAFMDHDISMPTCALYTHEGVISNGELDFPLWIKRGDGCAQVKEDTSLLHSSEEAEAVLQSFSERGVQRFVLQQHIDGDLIKFYGVAGTRFFDWDYASGGFSKFGLEQINGKEHGYPFLPESLKALADEAASVARTPIYGGDAIVDEHGCLYLIDFNDFPSFARCREAAAKAIAELITSL